MLTFVRIILEIIKFFARKTKFSDYCHDSNKSFDAKIRLTHYHDIKFIVAILIFTIIRKRTFSFDSGMFD